MTLALVMLASCGEAELATEAAEPLDDTVVEAQGFTVGWVPEGYEPGPLVEPDRAAPVADDTSAGFDSFAVVAPEGWSGDPASVVFVSAIRSTVEYALPETVDQMEPAARDRSEWRYPEGYRDGERLLPRQTIRRLDTGRALRAHTSNATMEVVDAILDGSTVVDDRPTVQTVPRGWAVLSSLEADAAANLGAPDGRLRAVAATEGARGAFVATWSRADSNIEVAVIDGAQVHLDAAGLARLASGLTDPTTWTVERASVGWWSEDTAGRRRELVTMAPSGALLSVSATATGALPSRADLERVARSVVIDTAAWDERMEAQRIAPPEPDQGRRVIGRGRVGEVEWLLQDLPSGDMSRGAPATTVPGERPSIDPGVDPVLYLTGGRMLTSNGQTRSDGVTIHSLDRAVDGLPPPFTATLVLVDEHSMSVAFPDREERHPTSPAPGGRYAVIVPAFDGVLTPLALLERYDAAGQLLTD